MEVTVDDLLSSMSQTLVQIKPKVKKVSMIEDRKFEFQHKPKPPKEMFYRKTLAMESQTTLKLQSEICTCKFLCFGSIATLKCLNCAVFDSTGLGYYCEKCFEARHPWYRVTHIVSPIYRNENIKQSIHKQQTQLQTDRRKLESYQLIDKIKHNQFKLTLVADEIKVDTQLRKAARKSVGLEYKLYQIRRKLRADIRSQGGTSEMTQQEAAMALQTSYRGFKVRSLISKAYLERTILVWDKSVGREYYFDKYLGTSSWTPSSLLLQRDLPLISTVDLQDPNRLIWSCKKNDQRRRSLRVYESEDASMILTQFFRCIVARKKIIQIALKIFHRVWDEDYSTYFYVDHRNEEETTWTKPKLFLTNEPLLLLLDDQKKLKRSPRLNRERIEEDQ